MSATVRGATGAISTSAASITVAETAASPQAGDVRYLFANTSSSAGVTITPPSGWSTVLATTAVGTGNLVVFSKPWVAGVGTETFTLSTSPAQYGYEIVAVTGASTTATPQTATNGGAAATTLTTAAITPTVSDGLLLAYFSQTQTTAASSATLSTPTGMTLLETRTAAGTGSGYTTLTGSAPVTSTATIGAFTSTANQSATWRTVVVVIPSGGGTAGMFFPFLRFGST